MQRASLQRSRDIEKEKEQLLATKVLASKLAEMKKMTNYISAIKPHYSDAESSSVSHEDCSLSIDSHVDIDYDFIMVSRAMLSLFAFVTYDMLVTIATERYS